MNGYIEIKYDENKAIFIDRNPKYFGYILDYLRMAGTENEFELPPGVEKYCLNKEAQFFNLRGLFNLTLPLFDSKILNEQLMADLLRLCQFSDGQKFKLLYRGSRDGFAASDFHSKCDNISKTVTVVKSRNGNIFGGYTDQCWDLSNSFKIDNNAFIYSLVNLNNSPIKIACSHGQNAIYCAPDSGPTFGSGEDLYISSNSNLNESSYSRLSNSYVHPGFNEQSPESFSRKYDLNEPMHSYVSEELKDTYNFYDEDTCKKSVKPNKIRNKKLDKKHGKKQSIKPNNCNKSREPQKLLTGSYNFFNNEIELFQCL